jgi:hypothetical protein
MKWLWILIALAFIFAGLSPQLRTRYTALPAVARRWGVALVFPRMAIRLEVIRR